MWTTEQISGLSVIVALLAAGIVLLNGYWDRKQHRHLKAYRPDLSIGPDPPPSMLRRVVQKHWYFYVLATIVVLQIGTMLFALRGDGPITRGLLVELIFIGLGILWNILDHL